MNCEARPVRLLPWSDDLGRPCFLVPAEDGEGPVSLLADRVEAEQLEAGAVYADYAHEVLSGETELPQEELRCLLIGLAVSLRNSLRIAHSRGELLGVATLDEFDEFDEFDETDDAEGGAYDGEDEDETAAAAGTDGSQAASGPGEGLLDGR